tara:strand:+ start:625 stop:951 length:327 start_codon:yes stop_codon:yes gene_type:complete
MILHLTDAEALAISQKLQEKSGAIELGEGAVTEINIESLNSAITKIQAGMIKSDEKLSRTLNTAIASLTSSGFDIDQIAALQGAKLKAEEHNAKKYPSKSKEAGVKIA